MVKVIFKTTDGKLEEVKRVVNQPNQGKISPPSRSMPRKPTPRLKVKGKRTVGNSSARISPNAPRRAPIQKSLPSKRSMMRSVELNPRVHHGHDEVGKDIAQNEEKGGNGQGSHDHRLIPAQESLILKKSESLDIEDGLDEDAPAY